MGVLRSFLSKQTAVGDAQRVAVRGFAPTTSIDDPISTAVVLTDTEGAALAALPVQEKNGDNTYGSAAGVAPSATATVVAKVAGAAYRLRGFTVTGTGDARASIQYDNVEKYFVVVSALERSPERVFPLPDAAAASKTVTLKVTNNSPATAGYEGALYGE